MTDLMDNSKAGSSSTAGAITPMNPAHNVPKNNRSRLGPSKSEGL